MERSSVNVRIPPDDRGMIGRSCPACGQYFKLKPGTGLPIATCTCAYCEHNTDMSDFATREQLEYAKSVALNEISRNLIDPMIRDWGKKLERSTKNSFIKLSVSYKSHPIPINRYQEHELETGVTCGNCGLEYSVFGVFATCPDCRQPNALDVFNTSLLVCRKRLDLLSSTDDQGLEQAILEDALSGAVSAFDALGKAMQGRYPAVLPTNPRNLFQNLDALSGALEHAGLPPLAAALPPDDLDLVVTMFQARHVFEHNMGVVDDGFCRKVPSLSHLRGRKFPLQRPAVERFIGLVGNMGTWIMEQLTESRREAE